MHIRWRGLELPSLVTCDTKTLTATYGKFVAEPFERGFGVTIGNSLAADPAVQPGRQRDHADQGAGRPARVHHHARRGRGRDRHRAQRQVAGGQELQRVDQGRPHRKAHQGRRHRRRRADRRHGRGDQQAPRHRHADRRRAVRRWRWWSRTAAATFRPPSTARTSRKSASFRSTPSTARWSASATRSKRPASARRRTTTS